MLITNIFLGLICMLLGCIFICLRYQLTKILEIARIQRIEIRDTIENSILKLQKKICSEMLDLVSRTNKKMD